MQRVVFDTNILLSAIGWSGKPYYCLELARFGTIEGITCWELIEELAEKLRTKLKFSDSQIIDIIADLLTFLKLVRITNSLKVVTNDPADDKVLECAIVSEAKYIITGDRRHLLPMKNYKGIFIVSANEFIELMSK